MRLALYSKRLRFAPAGNFNLVQGDGGRAVIFNRTHGAEAGRCNLAHRSEVRVLVAFAKQDRITSIDDDIFDFHVVSLVVVGAGFGVSRVRASSLFFIVVIWIKGFLCSFPWHNTHSQVTSSGLE